MKPKEYFSLDDAYITYKNAVRSDTVRSDTTDDYACAFTVKDVDGSLKKNGYTQGNIGNLTIIPCSALKPDGKYINETYADLCKDADYATYVTNEEKDFCKQLSRSKEFVKLSKTSGEDPLCGPSITTVPKGVVAYKSTDLSRCTS